MSTVRAAHLLIKHTGSRNPVSRRTNQTITTSPELAHEELLQFEAAILQQVNEEGVDLGTIFREYASERSDCSSFQQGGDLGEFLHVGKCNNHLKTLHLHYNRDK